MPTDWRERLERLPRLGWVDGPSPVDALPEMARTLGLVSLHVKRDDRLGHAAGLPGGTKVRKLDVLLAAPPFRDARGFASVGAIGSGHLVALSAASRLLGRHLTAHLFWEPPLPSHLESLAYVASGPSHLTYTRTRVGLLLRHPRALLATWEGELAVVPPGASTLLGSLGVVRGAVELADQIAAGECPAPAHLFVPLGSGGTLVGLWVGLALAGLPCQVHGVATVERLYSLEGRLRSQARALLAFLGAPDVNLPPLVLRREQLGPGYGVATRASLAECARFEALGVGLEPIYSGKAMAALAASAHGLKGPVVFWLTPRAAVPLPAADDWRERLPTRLQRHLADATCMAADSNRRRVFLGLGVAAATAIGWRFTGYPAPTVGLSQVPVWASGALRAAAEAILEPGPSAPELDDLVARVDAFLGTQTRSIRWQALSAVAVVEQLAGPLSGSISRLSRLGLDDRRAALTALAARGGTLAEAGRAVRDLCMLGHYQRPQTWPALGYSGPWVGEGPRDDGYRGLRSDAPPPGFEGGS